MTTRELGQLLFELNQDLTLSELDIKEIVMTTRGLRQLLCP